LGKKFPLELPKEPIASPGYVMSKCKWITIIREDSKDEKIEIWVSYKQGLMT
jgi:predicted DNA-binding protein (MmcQ/YjbR family)